MRNCFPYKGTSLWLVSLLFPGTLFAQASQPVSMPNSQPVPIATSQPVSQPSTLPLSQPVTQPTVNAELEAEFAKELSETENQVVEETSAKDQSAFLSQLANSGVLLLPNISLVGQVAGAFFPNGATDPDLRAHEPSDSGFTLQEVELAIQAAVDPFFRADVFFAFGLDEIEVEEGYITTLGNLPLGLQFRIGQFLTKFGRQNLQHAHAWDFTDLPLPNRRFFGGEGLRDLGVEANIRLPTGFFGTRGEFGPPLLTSELSIAMQQGTNEVSFGEKDFGAPLLEEGGFFKFLYTAQLSNFFDLSDSSGFTFGLSGAIATNDTTEETAEQFNRTALYGAHAYYRFRPAQGLRYTNVTAEFILREVQLPGALTREGGAYLQVAQRFNRNWESALRLDAIGFPSQIVGDETVLEEEAFAQFTPRNEYRASASVSYYTSEFFRLRLHAGVDRSDIDGDGTFDGFFPEIIFQANFSIGAHGAHAY